MREPSNDIISYSIRKISAMNFAMILLTIALAALGVLMQYSAGGGAMEPWAEPQLQRVFVGIVIMFVIALIPQRILFNYIYYLYGFGIFMLIIVEIFGHIGMGAQRWVRLGPLTIQPSEPMKIFLILTLARYFHMLNLEDLNRRFVPIRPLIMIVLPAALILHQPNLGTATILTLTGITMLFYSGVRLRFFIVCLALATAAAPLGWQFLHDYQKRRVMTFLEPEADPLGAGYNIMQSKIAIGSGGMSGKGFMSGTQSQLDFLPEKQTDFIFTMVSEELGFMGGIATIITYILMIAVTLFVAATSRNHFGRMAAAGVAAMIFFHVFINIGMVMGILPVVGVPLPLLSYGGTMILTAFAATGVVLNVYANRDNTQLRDAIDVFR